MKRTITLLVVEAIVIVGLLVPALALAQGSQDESASAEYVASLEQQIELLSTRLERNVTHVHLDVHNALGTPVDNVNWLSTAGDELMGGPFEVPSAPLSTAGDELMGGLYEVPNAPFSTDSAQ
jgi:hypothetical protein